MSTKSEIVSYLGQAEVMLPDLIARALVANDRAKVRMTVLQAALEHALRPAARPASVADEAGAVGLDATVVAQAVSAARQLANGDVSIPAAGQLIGGLVEDIDAMLAPVTAASATEARTLSGRLEALRTILPAADADTLATSDIVHITSARRDGVDTAHLLVMDLHKAINRIAAETAVESIDGAKVHRISEEDRKRVAAFMVGLNRTARLAFGHPGLGTTATRTSQRLTIQNDIGTTDAHVLVIAVENETVGLTYTDVHRRRAKFFIDLFAAETMDWTPLDDRSAHGLGKGDHFLLVTGTYRATDTADLDRFLGLLASRIVFLIDWNKARKALAPFTDKDGAISVLRQAAVREHGHRAFLEYGGGGLIIDVIRRVGSVRIPYGARLDDVLGAPATAAFLATVMRITSEGLTACRSLRLVRDEIQAELARNFETARSALLADVVRQAGLARFLAARLRDTLASGGSLRSEDALAIAKRGKHVEEKSDRIVVSLREDIARLPAQDKDIHLPTLVESIENAIDALEQACYFASLQPRLEINQAVVDELAALTEEATAGASDLVRTLAILSCPTSLSPADTAEVLQFLDNVVESERRADKIERRATSVLLGCGCSTPNMMLAASLLRVIEESTDHIARAAQALRDHMLGELAA